MEGKTSSGESETGLYTVYRPVLVFTEKVRSA